jgi:hypothetical protein
MPQQAKPQEKVAVTLSEKMEGMTLFEETKGNTTRVFSFVTP